MQKEDNYKYLSASLSAKSIPPKKGISKTSPHHQG